MSLLRVQQEVEDYLQTRILELLGGRNDEPAKYTILGSDINRIRHIFYYLRMNQTQVVVQYQLETYFAPIITVGDTTASIQIPNFEETTFRRLKLRFSFMNTFYQFEVLISKVQGDLITFQLPLRIQSATRRKYPRHRLDHSFVLFNTVYRPIFGTRGIGQIVEEKYRFLISELEKDNPNLSLMLRIVGEHLITIAGHYTLKLYKTDQPKSLMETMVSSHNKILYIGNTEDITSYIQKPKTNLLISYDRDFKVQANSTSEEEAMAFYKELQQKETRRHIYGYACAPIHLFGEVIGHIYIETDLIHRKKLFTEDAQQVGILANLLSYGMTKTVIAESYYIRPLAEILNLSLAGILFRVKSSTIYDYLIDHDFLKLKIPLMNEYLSFRGNITRMFSDGERYHVALRFKESGEDDYRKLEQYLYSNNRQRLKGKSRGQAP
ncbi:MAG: DUF1577 domain-containing protein [Leptonema sp. (in: Bacteria)]|nr:DUF1577 domain-containing protein [Leptonema sp. (in: bacteria)]